MIAGLMDSLKQPKNAVSWILSGWVLSVAGYFVFMRFTAEPAGQILGALGLAAILITLIRLGLTRLLYAIPIIILVVAYVGFYMNSAHWSSKSTALDDKVFDKQRQVTRWSPGFEDSPLGRKAASVVFAPAAMGHILLSGDIKGASVTTFLPEIKDASHTELGEGVRQYKTRTGNK